MLFSQQLNSHRIFKRQAKALIRLRVCAGWSEPLLVAHTTLLEISCRGSFQDHDVAHSIGVQNGFLLFYCLQEPIFDVLVIFFLKLEVYVCLVKSLLILSFYLSKQLNESPRTQNFGVKPL